MLEPERCLLELLATTPNGPSEALLLARGFSHQLILDLLQAGCLTKAPERTFAKGQPVYLTRVQITSAGRRALASQP
jgi:hypothetical protein